MSSAGGPGMVTEDGGHGLHPGQTLGGRYELRALLRISHLGARWSAWDRQLERDVTLKLLAPRAVSDPVAGEWLRRESLATARIRHPNVVQLYDVHHVDGTVCLSLEHVDGPSLETVGCGPFPAELVAAVGQQVASGLAAAHALHVVHRDIRPANLLLASSGHVKIANFTLSKLLDTSEQGITVETSLRDRFGYVAPEQLSDVPVGAAADVYALGLVLWEALNGHLPWHEADPLPADDLRQISGTRPHELVRTYLLDR